MRVADIVEDPRPERREVFEVGAGRPRVIYVLYPWKGETYFCKGGVVPYYEFKRPMSGRLTDEGFRRLLDKRGSRLSPWLERVRRE